MSRSLRKPPAAESSAFLRTGPKPTTSSRIDFVMPLPRSSRWNVMANLWASSRTCFTRYSDADPLGSTTGPLSCHGTKSSSSRLAKPASAISWMPISSNISSTALSCGKPPSRIIKSGFEPKRSSAMRSAQYRRCMTSCIDRKSLASSSGVLILKRRYWFLSGLPPVNTTMEATVYEPWMVEISKHSMRIGATSIASALSSCSRASLMRLSS